MESYIKIKSPTNRMNEEFTNSNDNYKIDNDKEIVFECLMNKKKLK